MCSLNDIYADCDKYLYSSQGISKDKLYYDIIYGAMCCEVISVEMKRRLLQIIDKSECRCAVNAVKKILEGYYELRKVCQL